MCWRFAWCLAPLLSEISFVWWTIKKKKMDNEMSDSVDGSLRTNNFLEIYNEIETKKSHFFLNSFSVDQIDVFQSCCKSFSPTLFFSLCLSLNIERHFLSSYYIYYKYYKVFSWKKFSQEHILWLCSQFSKLPPPEN